MQVSHLTFILWKNAITCRILYSPSQFLISLLLKKRRERTKEKKNTRRVVTSSPTFAFSLLSLSQPSSTNNNSSSSLQLFHLKKKKTQISFFAPNFFHLKNHHPRIGKKKNWNTLLMCSWKRVHKWKNVTMKSKASVLGYVTSRHVTLRYPVGARITNSIFIIFLRWNHRIILHKRGRTTY